MHKALALLLLAGCATASSTLAPLRTSPAHVYKAADPGREGTESCTLMLILPDGAVPAGAEIAAFAGPAELERRALSEAGVRSMTIKASIGTVIRFQVRRPAADKFDDVRGTVTMTDGRRAPFDVPVAAYTPKTKLIFPFRGPGMISSGGVNDGGHRNSSGQYALDVLALTDDYGPMICADDKNECSAGFGRREIVAPADGVVVKAWNDIPDNVSWENVDPKTYTRADGTAVDTGNSVVIDHGNGEFTMIAHMKQGTVRVHDGQTVHQGDVLGLLGNSGEAYGPHVHVQLQNSPDPRRSDGLPLRFENVPRPLVRGMYFNAK